MPQPERSILLEVCTASVTDCLVAARHGADRIELNAALSLGGLTPSLATMEQAVQAVDVPVIAMLRPRDGGFRYSTAEFTVMQRDADLLLERGVAGLAFGVLHDDGRIDVERCAAIISQCGDRQTVFHRAFDVTPDPFHALEQLIDLGITRVLTSGQAATALEGAATLKTLFERAADRIDILPGCGVSPDNVRALIEQTGCTQVHGSFSAAMIDPTTSLNPAVSFASTIGDFGATDGPTVAAMRQILNEVG